jgi:hypothetical protein
MRRGEAAAGILADQARSSRNERAYSGVRERLLRAILASRFVLFGVAFFLCAPASGACGRPSTTQDRLLGERARTPAPSSTGSCNFDLTSPKDETVFFVLGGLDEYLGRAIVEDGDVVERFYCNEASTAATFRRHLAKMATEQEIAPAIREDIVQQCLISFHSKAIADRVNSCYRYQTSSDVMSPGADGFYRRTATASLKLELFMRNRSGEIRGDGLPDEIFYRRRALAYLAGAWMRYGRGTSFGFANAGEKATLVAQLLTHVGARNVRLETTFGQIPQGNAVHFQPTAEITQWLRKVW